MSFYLQMILKIFWEISSIDDCNMLQQDLNNLQRWSDDWLLKFHLEKCKVLEVGRTKSNFDYKLKVTSLVHVNQEKDIGFITNSKLKFDDHMNEKIKKGTVCIIRKKFQVVG